MTRAACPMAPLIEAYRDGRLGERDVASLDRHFATCAPCRAARDRLERIADRIRLPLGEGPSPLSHQRTRLALMRAAASGPRPAAPRRAGAALALAVVAALGSLVAVRAGSRAHDPVPIAARLPPVRALPRGRTETTVVASFGARFERASKDRVDRIDLADGALDIQVRPLRPDERFLVATSDAEVEVRGTVFHVEAHEGRLSGVVVDEGKVEVRHHGTAALISAGHTWKHESEAAPAASDLPAAAAGAGRRSAARGPQAAPPKVDASRTFADGVGLVERGDYAAAAEKLDAFRASNPSDARAEDAAYLAILSWQRAGRTAEVAAAARRYLELFPNGPRRAAVKAILEHP